MLVKPDQPRALGRRDHVPRVAPLRGEPKPLPDLPADPVRRDPSLHLVAEPVRKVGGDLSNRRGRVNSGAPCRGRVRAGRE